MKHAFNHVLKYFSFYHFLFTLFHSYAILFSNYLLSEEQYNEKKQQNKYTGYCISL